MVKITVLNDNASGRCPGEHGLSYLIEADKKILFDTGPSDIFLKNAKTLGINIDDVDFIVLSHGHWDHGNGLPYIKNKKLICHSGCFAKRYRKKDDSYIGLKMSHEQIQKKFNLILSDKPYKISKDIFFLGEILRNNNFESKTTPFYLDGKKDDFIDDESALAIKTKKGLIIIAGCSHPGICNIIDYAKKVTGLKKVYSVIGGFHLKKVDEVTLKTIEYLKHENVPKIYSSHCTDDIVVKKLNSVFGSERLHSGDILNL